MVWDGFIACYLFLAGLGAGAFALGVLANAARTPAPTMRRIAFVVAPAAVAAGSLVLVFDAKAGFANPLRFFLLISNPASVMSWGTAILSAFLLVSVVDALVLFVRKCTPPALDALGALLAVCVAAYTGVLLGQAGLAFPLWNAAILPVLFVVSAASSGMAAVLIATRLKAPKEAAALPFLSKAGLALPAAELVLVGLLLAATSLTGGSAAPAAAASVQSLLSGSYAPAFWIGLVVVGMALPFGTEFLRRRRKPLPESVAGGSAPRDRDKALALVGECGALVGGFMLRYLVVMAAAALVFA